MSYDVVFHPEALQEYEDAHRWYRDKLAGLENRFEAEVNSQLQSIANNPQHFHFVKGRYREANVSVFPFTIVYMAYSRTHIIFISSIHHTSRNPRLKFRK